MGKKRGNLTGLSQFALKAFGETSQLLGPKPDQATLAAHEHETSRGPSKKRKIALSDEAYQRYDASSLAPHYTHASQVPSHLQKYFSQRRRYFLRYDEGCLLDDEGWYSVTPERVAEQIAERCRCDTVLDAFCGVGGNAIAFAKTCERVIALDTSPVRLALARHNAAIYGVADRIEFILADYISFARSYVSLSSRNRERAIDVVFLSPPWGGPSYLSSSPAAVNEDTPSDPAKLVPEGTQPPYRLSSIQPIHGADLFRLSRQITPNVAFFLPRHTLMEDVALLTAPAGPPDPAQKAEMIEVEEEWMGSKLKALTCYFGGLVSGQEHLF